MFALMVAASGLFLHQMKQRSDQVSDTFDPDAVHDATIVSEMKRVGSMKSISSSQNLSTLEGGSGILNTSATSSSSSLAGLGIEEDQVEDKDIGREEEPEVRCRFCFQDEQCGDLIAPCQCTGSQEYVHLKCLRMWQKVSLRSNGCAEKNCRVCKHKYILPYIPLKRRVAFYFSLKAKDRLNEYTKAWCDVVATAVMQARLQEVVSPLHMVRRSNSLAELAVLMAMSELRIFARRAEINVGSAPPAATSHPKIFGGEKIKKGVKLLGWSYTTLNLFVKFHHAVNK